MSGTPERLEAIAAVTKYQPSSSPLNFVETPSSELFGSNVFSVKVMKSRLPKEIFKRLLETIGDRWNRAANGIAPPMNSHCR